MIRIIIFLTSILIAGLALSWVADRPGAIHIDWMGYDIQLSVMTAIIVIAILIVAVILLLDLMRTLIKTPQILSGYFASRKRDRGYQALSEGMIAIGAGDQLCAQRAAKKAKSLLKNEPMALLLQTQAAQLACDREKAKALLKDMVSIPETKMLGLHGLYREAVRLNDDQAQLAIIERALSEEPKSGWANLASLHYYADQGEWEKALQSLQNNIQYMLFERKESKRIRAVLLTALAMERADIDAEDSENKALEAYKIAPDLVPAAWIAAKLLSHHQDYKKAIKILEANWKKSPHPDIAELYVNIRTGDSIEDRYKRALRLDQLNKHALEGAHIAAKMAIEAQHFQKAEEILAPFLGDGPRRKSCLLMAQLADKKDNNIGQVKYWLQNALKAQPDPVWMADGVKQQGWAPFSPISGRFDVYEWVIPQEDYETQLIDYDFTDHLTIKERPERSQEASETKDLAKLDPDTPNHHVQTEILAKDQKKSDAESNLNEVDKKQAAKENENSQIRHDHKDSPAVKIEAEEQSPITKSTEEKNTQEKNAQDKSSQEKAGEDGFILPSRPDDPGPKQDNEPSLEKRRQTPDQPFNVF